MDICGLMEIMDRVEIIESVIMIDFLIFLVRG